MKSLLRRTELRLQAHRTLRPSVLAGGRSATPLSLSSSRPSVSARTAFLHTSSLSCATTSAGATTIDSSIFPVTRGFDPVVDGKPHFRKILIANRGEIACRIMRTAKKLGIRTVAIYSEADRDSMHVQMADEAYCIGPAPSSESYLRMDKILEVARQSGSEAIHPGYGFMSESTIFAKQVTDAGMVFIGPPAEAIRSMGSKRESKEIMLAAGVPCVPGYHGAAQDIPTLLSSAKEVGFPLLIKPTHGGGGKGMRTIRSSDPAVLEEEIMIAKREALKSFGNDEVLLERWLERPRHVEVQVFADMEGEVVSLWERDCSVQRRHQKIIEEAPAPGLSMELKKDLAEKAKAAAKAVKYVGAGTVEFIMDAETGEYFFMEMNTRLQVEHPVTEMVTGVDLVEWQLLVAAGNPLPMKQSEVPCIGHSFEARIYAERPEANFLPDAGRLIHTRAPIDIPHRLETGFWEGDEISSYYDPMIAKLIVHGKDRAEALSLLQRALGQYQVLGPSTNIEFLKAVAGHEAFVAGPVETNFVPIHHDELFKVEPVPNEILAQAAVFLMTHSHSQSQSQGETSSQTPQAGVWTSPGLMNRRFGDSSRRTFILDDQIIHVTSSPDPGVFQISIGDYTTTLSPTALSPTEMIAQFPHTRTTATIIPFNHKLHLFANGKHYTLSLPLPEEAEGTKVGAGDRLSSPMPATVIEVRVKVGDVVKEGQVCAVLESMKMEISIRAGRDGVVGEVGVEKGQVVEEGNMLIALKPEAEAQPDA